MRATYSPYLVVFLLFPLLAAAGCGNGNGRETMAEPVSETYFIFDTIIQIRVYDPSFTDAHAGEIGSLLEQIDARLNRHESGSEIDAVNRQAGVSAVQVSGDTFAVVKSALQYAAWSEGRFDPTVGPLVDLWGIGGEDARVPDPDELEKRLALVNYRNVELDETSHTVFLKQAGMALDLGAIGKGYAADVIRDYMLDNGFDSAILDLGGNLVALGGKPDGSDWSIGIQDPAEGRGEHLGIVRVKDKTLVSSGVYERYFREGDRLYHHILDPKTGYPVDNELLSVTIVTDRSTDADALSTSIFAMGLAKGWETVENMAGTDAIFVTNEGELYVTSGLDERFAVTNSSYARIR